MRKQTHPVMLFAAGFGTRMGGLTAHQPKPLVRVAGKSLIDHALDLVRDYGANRVAANLHYLPEPLEAHLADTGVALLHETPDILETGGGLRHALPVLGAGPVITMNTDAVWSGPNPLGHLAALWNPEQMDALLLCIAKTEAIGHAGVGDFIVGDDMRAKRGPGAVYSGVQIIKTEMLHDIPKASFSLNLLWDKMLAEDRLFATSYPGKWCDVGRPEGIKLAEEMLGWPDV